MRDELMFAMQMWTALNMTLRLAFMNSGLYKVIAVHKDAAHDTIMLPVHTFESRKSVTVSHTV